MPRTHPVIPVYGLSSPHFGFKLRPLFLESRIELISKAILVVVRHVLMLEVKYYSKQYAAIDSNLNTSIQI